MLESYTFFLLIGFSIVFSYKRLRLLVHFFQQEEYDNKRFLSYVIKGSRLIDKKFSLALLVSSFFTCLLLDSNIFLLLISSSIVIIFSCFERNPSKKAKKVLSFTARVKRILSVSFFILFAVLSTFLILFDLKGHLEKVLLIVFIIQFLPFFLILSNAALRPFEKKIQNRYLNEAKKKIVGIKPIIIGVTGSYGKTSVKHILCHILSSVFPTLKTPGSVNTQMGITRIIREKLKKDHKYFIVEMGAYGKGSIKRLCELTPPHYGIITSVGNAHYERFQSIENVAKTKFELHESVKDQKGYTFINADAIEKRFISLEEKNIIQTKEYPYKMCSENPSSGEFYKRISKSMKDDYLISDIKQTKKGLQFKIIHKNKIFSLKTPLYGTHHVGNIVLCFAIAQKIGLDPHIIVATLRSVPQIKHRLEVIRSKRGAIIIDDAYNSNPTGFLSALEVLNVLKKDNGRRILVTPGMIELGKLHEKKHKELGKEASKYVDVVLAISPKRIHSFICSFEKSMDKNQKIYKFNTFAEAKKWIESNATEKDTILYENDLPDLYENAVYL